MVSSPDNLFSLEIAVLSADGLIIALSFVYILKHNAMASLRYSVKFIWSQRNLRLLKFDTFAINKQFIQ